MRLENAYRAWASDGLQALIGRLESRNALAGRGVVVDGVRGTAGRLAADGRLSVRLDDGRELRVEERRGHGSGAERRCCRYSTVTVLARLRGWSTFSPRSRAIR